MQQVDPLHAREVADGPAQQCEEHGPGEAVGQVEPLGHVGHERPDRRFRVGPPQPLRNVLEELAADVDGDIDRGLHCRVHGVQDGPGLVRCPRAQLHQGGGAVCVDPAGHVLRQETTLRAGGVVFLQPCDLLEEPASALVVEELRGQRFLGP